MSLPLPVNNSEEEMKKWFSIRIRFNPIIMIPWWLFILALLTLLIRESIVAAKKSHESEQILSYALVVGLVMGTLYGMICFVLYVKDLWTLFSCIGDNGDDSMATMNSASSFMVTMKHYLHTIAKRYMLVFFSKDQHSFNYLVHSTETV